MPIRGGRAKTQRYLPKRLLNFLPVQKILRRRSGIQKASSLGSACFQLYADHPLKRFFRSSRNFRGRFTFFPHRQNHPNLLLVVAGYKPGLWPYVLRRIQRFLPEQWDVCLCVPGTDQPALRELAKNNQWSFLQTTRNQLAAAQNLAIREHPSATMIAKIDEDIFLTEGCLGGLAAAFSEVKTGRAIRPGIIAPLINVNGFCARTILNRTGLLEVFEKRFGTCWESCTDTPAWQNPEAAKFLWESTAPLEPTAGKFRRAGVDFAVCPQRFSIGCFAMERDFWSAMQGFTVAPSGDLGVEEIDLAAHCAATSRPIVIAKHLLVGHAGFGDQMSVMEPWLLANADKLEL
jgi:hypothetical protein